MLLEIEIFILTVLLICCCIYLTIRKNEIRKGKSRKGNSGWIDTSEFEKRKASISRNISEQELDDFIKFLNRYKGGYIKRFKGNVIRNYKGSELGALKGIFYNIVIPSSTLSVSAKERFRNCLNSLGVIGVEIRPEYEQRDSKLRNNESNIDDYERKVVGNKGENKVRDILGTLDKADYKIINGCCLKVNDVVHEIDHIVICRKGVFVLETKAFGESMNGNIKSGLFIDKGDKWILRKKGVNKELKSPTDQISEEKNVVDEILKPYYISSKPILVLSNENIYVKQNISLAYEVVKLNELIDKIDSENIIISESDILGIISDINQYRIN